MTVRELGPEPAEVQLLRAELDELLRARQFAAQRERRLAEALRGRHEPDHSPSPHHPPRQPDPELARQLAQAQNLREGLGARCLELSNRLLAAEDRLMAGRLADRSSRQTGQAAAGAATAPPPAGDPHGPGPAFVPSQRPRPTGARFGGVRNGVRTPPAADTPDFLDVPAVVPAPDAAVDAPPLRGARFRSGRLPRPTERNAATATGAPAADAPAAGTGPHPEADHAHPGRRPHPSAGPGPSGQYPHETSAAGAADRPRSRTKAELAGLVQRITELHREGAVHESAAIVEQVALLVTPLDLAGLAALLKSDGPSGAAAYLARSVANGTPEHAAAVLAELRREGLVDEAADLFHALWSVGSRELPALLAALEQTGQSADSQTLLWERASAPAAELAELTHWLREAGRSGDARHLLRQAAGRPVGEVAEIATALSEDSAVELVRELVRLRSAGDIGRFATVIHGSAELYEALLFAADGLEESRSRSAFAALRSAGLPTEPAPRPRSRSRQRR